MKTGPFYNDLMSAYNQAQIDSEKFRGRGIMSIVLTISTLMLIITTTFLTSLPNNAPAYLTMFVVFVIGCIGSAFAANEFFLNADKRSCFERQRTYEVMTRRINRIAASGGRYLQDPGESDFIRMVIDMLEFTIAIKEDKVVSKLILETLFDKNLNGGTSLEIMRKVSEASIKNTGDNTEILSLQNSILNILEELYLDNECLYGIEKEHSAVRKIVEQNLDK